MQSHSTLPSGVCDKQRPLRDREPWLRADTRQAGFLFAELVLEALLAHLVERCPLLALPADVLSLVFADDAVRGGESLSAYWTPQVLQM